MKLAEAHSTLLQAYPAALRASSTTPVKACISPSSIPHRLSHRCLITRVCMYKGTTSAVRVVNYGQCAIRWSSLSQLTCSSPRTPMVTTTKVSSGSVPLEILGRIRFFVRQCLLQAVPFDATPFAGGRVKPSCRRVDCCVTF